MQFVCPKCRQNLIKDGNSLKCENSHCFDIAKQGYVNLLLGSGSGNHGDNKLMLWARKAFLDGGYYEKLKNAVAEAVSDYASDGARVIDCGCGEGYYTSAVCNAVAGIEMCAFDISKDALKLACKRNSGIEYAVASSFDIPVRDESVDILLEIFSPHAQKEFSRILKPDGIMIMVIPLKRHLFELKQAVYDEPYENEVAPFKIDGYTLLENREVKYKFSLNDTQSIKNLFMMTPYYYKTGVKEQARLNTLQHLDVSAEFSILIYKKSL